MKKLFLLFALCLSGCWNMGQKSLKGYIVKMDGTGVIFRTMEIKMMEGSLNSGHMSDEINVPENLVSKFQDALDKGTLVKVIYHHELLVAPWRGASSDIADDIQPLP